VERKANYLLIGLFTVAVVAGAFGFAFWIHHSQGKKQSVAYRVIFDSPVSGLLVGAPVVFNGIRVGNVTGLSLNADHPSQVVAMLSVNKATPIRSDTRVGLEFTGLTGVASVSLKGVSATTPLIEREEGEPPTLKAQSTATQDMMQAVRETLNNANAIIADNQAALHQAVTDLAKFSAALARNSDGIDEVVKNTKEATASVRDLAGNLDKRTKEITAGVNRVTDSANKQINIVGGDAHRALVHIDTAVGHIDEAVTDLAKNPQRILFGSGNK